MSLPSLIQLEDYQHIVGDETIERIKSKAEKLQGMRVVHMNSTYYAGGVVEILTSLVTLMNQLGIKTEWRLLRGSQEFFEVTREMHDAVQNGQMELTDEKKQRYEHNIYENAFRNHLDHDAVFMHDHHTMGMVAHYRKRGPWIWRCHLDFSHPQPEVIEYLKPFAEKYDAAIFTLEEYKQDFSIPQVLIFPAIDPLKISNRELSEDVTMECLRAYGVPTDLPIVTQISRYDRWKDPHGVIDAFELARQEVDATLVLLGNTPSDDPDTNVYDSVLERRSKRVLVLSATDYVLNNALQRHSAVVLQKSLREGFGMTVTEALWKGTPVIGGNAGGIPYQIDHGVNGYLVNSPEEAAKYIVDLVSNPEKAAEMGRQGREKVRKNFLITRLLEDHLDLLGGFEARYIYTNGQ